MNKRLALNDKGEMTWCTSSEENVGKGRCNHIVHQNKDENTQSFVERIGKAQELYGGYIIDDKFKETLDKKMKKALPDKLIDEIKKSCGNESWIIAYGYDDQPYCNNGGWNKTEPYPFITSDGKKFTDMYIDNSDIYNINEENFVTAFNKNKENTNKNGYYILDKDKKIYKSNYPNVDDYDHVFIKHIPSK